MTDAKPKRLSTWKILGIIAGVVVVLLLITAFWVRSVTGARWARFQEEMKAGVEKERTRDFRRPVLRGPAEPGNAWDDYAVALAEMKKVPNRTKLGELVERKPAADPVVGAAMVEQSGAVLEPLRRGAVRSTSRFAYQWEQGSAMAFPGFVDSQNTANLAVLKARSLLDAGKPREAVALLLDAAQFGRDFADDGPLISEMGGIAVLSISTEGIRELAASEKAGAEALADLEQGLAVLDGSFPKHSECLRREQLDMGMTLLSTMSSETASWGFVAQLFYLNTHERIRETREQVALACDRPWAESLATASRTDAELKKSWNPMTRMMATGPASSERYIRERLAQLRLLRESIHYRRTGERLDLADPFGTTLRSAPSSTGLKLWSSGADGIDDGGSGEWRASKGPDIVLEARR